jgi:hypothetical protein
MRYRRRTLLIVLAVGPMMLAVGYDKWIGFTAKATPGAGWIILPHARPGFHWELSEDGPRQVPDDSAP